jgi:hypothetical protein
LHSRETSFVGERAAIANTLNVADRLRSRICLPTLPTSAASFHNVNQHTYTIGHPVTSRRDQMTRTSGDSVSQLRLHTCFNSSFPDRWQANLHFGADTSSMPESTSLYARLGGYDAIAAASEDLVGPLMADQG